MKIKKIVNAAVIAAIYAVISILAAPISYGPVQVRISEALTVLPAVSQVGIWGVFIGCLLANIYTGSIVDIIFGSLTTLIAGVCSYMLKDRKWLVPLPPIVLNAVVVGYYLSLGTGVKNVLFTMLTVGVGQTISCYVLGFPLLMIISNNIQIKKYLND